MQYCPKCRINIKGNKSCCPLCQGELTGEPVEDVFPQLVQRKISQASLMKITTFCFAAVEIVFAAIYFLLVPLIWIPFTMAGLAAVWLDFVLGIYYRHNIIKNITLQVYLAMLVCLLADRFYTNPEFQGWSIQWVLPCCFVGLVITTISVGKGLRYRLDEYILYLAVDMVLSMIQLVFILLGMNAFVWPAAISLIFVWVLAAAALIFRFRILKNAVQKSFHM